MIYQLVWLVEVSSNGVDLINDQSIMGCFCYRFMSSEKSRFPNFDIIIQIYGFSSCKFLCEYLICILKL